MKNIINDLEEIAHLYDEFYLIPEVSLLQEPVAVSKEKEKTEKKLIYEGKNLKQIVFLYQSLESGFADIDKSMLNKLVAALHLTWDDIASVNLHQNNDFKWSEILQEVKATKTVSWGCLPKSDHTIESIDNCKTLYAMNISTYHDNIPLKTELWKQMQQLFND